MRKFDMVAKRITRSSSMIVDLYRAEEEEQKQKQLLMDMKSKLQL